MGAASLSLEAPAHSPALIPEHATGGTDYYVPYVQHLWEPSYVPPTRNDVIAERLSSQGHDILFEHKMVKLAKPMAPTAATAPRPRKSRRFIFIDSLLIVPPISWR